MTEQLSKSAARFHDFHSRTGSHSTKGFQNGRVDVLPPQAKEEDLKALPLIDQYRLAKRNYHALRDQFQADLSSNRLKPQHPRFNEVREEVKKAKGRFMTAKQKLHLARMEQEGAMFKEVCRSRLRHALYIEICKAVEQLEEYTRARAEFDSAFEAEAQQ